MEVEADKTEAPTEPCLHSETVLAHSGYDALGPEGFINPPLHRATTVLFRTPADYADRESRLHDGYFYGPFGTPISRSLERTIAGLEGGAGAIAIPSATAAISLIAAGLLRAGSHMLLPTSAYFATKQAFAEFAKFDVIVEEYAPGLGRRIADLIRPTTQLIWLESPGSLLFEIQDLPAITEEARARGVLSGCDATWATPLGLSPLKLGADLSLHSATKYLSGTSELSLGILTSLNADLYRRLRSAAMVLGLGVSADDCFAVLRGMKSLAVRVRHQSATARALAIWLESQDAVGRVFHPALVSHPDHALWLRDFRLSSGLFSFSLPSGRDINAFSTALRCFRSGAGWGGPTSLLAIYEPGDWPNSSNESWLIRVQVGMEDLSDLREDLERGLAATV